MKLVYISKYASYGQYGLETRQFYLSREFSARGYDCTVYISTANHYHTSRINHKDENVDGVNVCWVKTLNYKSAYGVKRILSWFHFEIVLRRKLKRLKLNEEDIVIVSSLSLLSIFNGIYLKKRWGCKLVLEVRDIWPLVLKRISNISSTNPFYMFLAYVEKLGYENADLIVGTMPYLNKHVQNVTSSFKKVIWIPHLVNRKIKYLDINPYSQEFNTLKSKERKVIGFAGSLNKTSALTYLLECAPSFEKIGVSICILGDGPLKSILQLKYKDSNIYFFDKVPQNQVVAFLKSCDFLYDGYLKSDIYSFGNSRNKYVEYCLSAKPMVVAFEGSDFFVDQIECGLTLGCESSPDIYNGVCELLKKDATQLAKMGNNALKFAETQLQVEHQVDALIKGLTHV